MSRGSDVQACKRPKNVPQGLAGFTSAGWRHQSATGGSDPGASALGGPRYTGVGCQVGQNESVPQRSSDVS